MAPQLEWQRGPITGRLILYADGALWPRAEIARAAGGALDVVLFPAADGAMRVVGRFTSSAEARAAAERALMALAGSEVATARSGP